MLDALGDTERVGGKQQFLDGRMKAKHYSFRKVERESFEIIRCHVVRLLDANNEIVVIELLGGADHFVEMFFEADFLDSPQFLGRHDSSVEARV